MKRVAKVICYVMRGTNLLVFRQPKFPEAGLQVPAGTIEADEPPEIAAVREAQEETGLQGIHVLHKLGVYDFDMSKWKPEIHERHVFALNFTGLLQADWTHWELQNQDDPRQSIEFSFSWTDLREGDPDLIADQGRFISELRSLLSIESLEGSGIAAMVPVIRKAEMRDRESIHAAHMRSIREVCAKDHGPEEIKGWGYRELGERWIDGINKELVWVVERDHKICGLASITFADDGKSSHIQSLYLTPEVIGLGVGRKLMTTMMDEAKRRKIRHISLDSTITAHDFYKKFGFQDSGPSRKRPIGGAPVTSIPMVLSLSDIHSASLQTSNEGKL